MEYRELAEINGIEQWRRVPALNTDERFINDMADIVVRTYVCREGGREGGMDGRVYGCAYVYMSACVYVCGCGCMLTVACATLRQCMDGIL